MTLPLALALAIVLLALLLWLLLGPQKSQPARAWSALEIKQLLPVHCRHFPQIRLILSTEDEIFLKGRMPSPDLKQWRAERKHVLRLYVHGLSEDFEHLQQLARLISAFSPEVKRSREWELLWLGLEFRARYRLTLLRLALRALPLEELAKMTELVAGLGFELGHFINRMTERLPRVGVSSTTQISK